MFGGHWLKSFSFWSVIHSSGDACYTMQYIFTWFSLAEASMYLAFHFSAKALPCSIDTTLQTSQIEDDNIPGECLSNHTTECQWVTHETITQYILWTWKLRIFNYWISNLVHRSDLHQIKLTFPSASQLYFQLLHMAPCQIAQKCYMSKHWALYQRTLYGSYEHDCIKWE